MKTMRRLLAAAAVLPAIQLSAQNYGAPSQLAPVTVTGSVVNSIPQSASSAATVVSGEEVRVGEITSTRDLTAQTPNLTVFDANDDRTPRFSFRGFRENNFAVGEPAVGLYVDDIPYFDLNSRGLALFDTRDIQFIRGEQGALYGVSGPGGVINVTTMPPQNRTRGYAEASYGNYNAQNYQAGLSGPLVTNKLFFGVNGLDAQRDGFVYNNIEKDNPDHHETLALRGVLRWTPSDSWNITLMANAGRDNDGFVPTYEPGLDASPLNAARDYNGFVHTDNLDEALKIGYEGSSVRFISVMTHRQWDQNVSQEIPPPPPFSPELQSQGFTQPRLNQWTEELRFESPDPAAVLKWRAGFYYADAGQNAASGSVSLAGPNPTFSDTQSQTGALFGQATYTLFDRLDLTAGVRLTYDYRHMERDDEFPPNFLGPDAPAASASASLSDEFTAAQPKFGIAWHFSPAIEAYGTATEGYQSGGFNPYEDNPALSKFSAERDWQFEIGAKSAWMDDKLSANAGVFYTVADNYPTYRIDPTDPLEAYMLNARRADLYGAELELTARPIDGLNLSAGAGYTEARYSRFTEPPAASANGMAPVDLDGKAISFVPEFTANASARYRLPKLHIFIHGEVIGVGRYHLDDSYTGTEGPVTQDAYCLVNAQIGYESKHFEIYLFAKNIFDKRYYNNALNLGYPTLILQTGDPGMYGIAATARF
ncbi:MAG TPA: TonB-dependent receptor [Verrucomicrobiae bacterium]